MAVFNFFQQYKTELTHLRYHLIDDPDQGSTFRKINVMARLTSIPPFIGTKGPVTIYYMFGKPFMRSRSSLTGERVKKDPVFRNTMKYADLMAMASPIASKVYAFVLLQHKSRKLFNKINGEVIAWLKYGWNEEDIIEWLTPKYTGVQLPKEAPVTVLRLPYRRSRPVVSNTIKGLFKNIPVEQPSFDLLAWRRRDKQFRKELYKACQQ